MTSSGAPHHDFDLSLYGGRDPRELPRYTYLEAARATDVPPTTIGAWFRGQTYPRKHSRGMFRPVLQRPDPTDTRLSFNNLLEVFALRSLREYHKVKLEKVRQALDVAERQFDIPRLLISSQLRTSGGDLFLDTYFDLVQLTPAIQHSIRSVLKQYLERIHFEDIPRFFPTPRTPHGKGSELILVSPLIAFGRPVVGRVGVSTEAIATRVNAGEDPAAVLDDYSLKTEEFDEALAYESAFAYDPAA
jgi:uncharacterized protein (DUF433 family)